MSNGYLKQDEIRGTKPIKITPPLFGFESQRAIILMKANGQPLGSYLWNSLVANSSSDSNQRVIERAIAQESDILQSMGQPHDYISSIRSLLAGSGVFELTETGLLVPTTSGFKSDDATLEG